VQDEKSRRADVKDWEIAALIERIAFGDDLGDEADVMKSPDETRFVVVSHPRGSDGAVTESKRSTKEGGIS
jgi:hypothetical protein